MWLTLEIIGVGFMQVNMNVWYLLEGSGTVMGKMYIRETRLGTWDLSQKELEPCFPLSLFFHSVCMWKRERKRKGDGEVEREGEKRVCVSLGEVQRATVQWVKMLGLERIKPELEASPFSTCLTPINNIKPSNKLPSPSLPHLWKSMMTLHLKDCC